MCSVVGCHSWRRGAQRFKLPEDPERRLEWVQFLAAVNKQRFKESSWTDITICREHFIDNCFEKLTWSRSGMSAKVQLTLKPGAVPSLCLQTDEPETPLDSPEPGEAMETIKVVCVRDQLTTCHDPSEDENSDLIREGAALLQIQRRCPSCGCKLQTEKVTYGGLVVLNQQCLQCEYRNQWKNQVSASDPTAGDQNLAGGSEVTPEIGQEGPTDDTYSSAAGVPEVVAVIDDETDLMDETSSDQGDLDSDEDWKPVKGFLLARVCRKQTGDKSRAELRGDSEAEHGDCPSFAPQHSQLCTDCGLFFNKHRPHTCEHIIKPYCCNICGKRCVSEVALNCHSRVHDENYEHRCKYCHVAFRTKVDKHTHEQIHLFQGKPYKCPDCSERFATNKERRTHLEDHRGPPQLKCDICGIEFLWPLSLRRHLRVHTGMRPFKCSVCQRGFNQASHLKSHMRLHTGERPYKCQHCDKCFNHNVSLKSHVQRYHTSNSGREQTRAKMNERKSDAVNSEGNVDQKDADSGRDNAQEAQDTEEEEQNERADIANSKKRSTGRPRGRPRRNSSGSLALTGQRKGQVSDARTRKVKAQRLKRTQSNDEECEDELSESATSFDSAEEEEEKSQKVMQHAVKARKTQKKF